jgi:hypothetical protein
MLSNSRVPLSGNVVVMPTRDNGIPIVPPKRRHWTTRPVFVMLMAGAIALALASIRLWMTV